MKIEFIANLPPIKSAMLLDGLGDGGQIKLDIPRAYASALIEVHKIAGKRLKVTIEEDAMPDDALIDFRNQPAEKIDV